MPSDRTPIAAKQSHRESRSPLPLHVDPTDAQRVERVIAFARIVLASTALLTTRIDPTAPSRYGELMSSLLAGYTSLAGLLVLLFLRSRPLPRVLPLLIHAGDICFAAVLTRFSYGPSSPLFVFLLYPLLAAGYRWGFREVVLTAGVVDGLLAVQVALIASTPTLSMGMVQGEFGLSSLVLRATYVVMAGIVVGYLAENEKRRRFEAVAISHILSQAQVSRHLGETVDKALMTVRQIFKARKVLLVAEDQTSGRVFLRETGETRTEEATAERVPAERRSDYLFEAPGAAWHAVASWLPRRRFTFVAVGKRGEHLPSGRLAVPDGFLRSHRCRRILGVSIDISDEWTGRMFVLDPAVGVHREQNARFGLHLANQVGTLLYGHYLIHRLRTRAQALERGRIARELHDGVTQSLLGLEMQVAVLRRRVLAEAPQLDVDLARLHGIIRNEIITLRELMEGVRAAGSESGDIQRDLGELVERFSRYTGIAAQFVSDRRQVTLPTEVRREVARIIHEGLINVRKHSGARRVLVRATVDDGYWRISIEDDGRGFPFAGRQTQAELEAKRRGPRVLGERVRMVHGEMSIESRPGSGATVDVAIPLQQAS